MADEKQKPGADAAEAAKSSSSPAEKPARTRKAVASKQPDQAAATPARTARAVAKPETAEEAAKPRRARAAAKKTDEAAAEASAKPGRARVPAKTVAAEAAGEAPAKPARSRVAVKKPAAAPAGEVAAAAKPAKPARGSAPAKTSAKAAPAPVRKARPVGPVTVRAQARYVRSSARKARLVCNHIRGKSVPEARALLGFAPRGVASDWAKLLNSAVANAEHNHELAGYELRVKAAYADEGPTLKRFRTRAMGRATPIHKRTSHLTIMLGPKE